MKISVRALALTIGLLWGGAVLIVGLANLIWPNYGTAFLQLAASIYPGYRPGTGVGSLIVGALYALVDGLVGGAFVGWLYNALLSQQRSKS